MKEKPEVVLLGVGAKLAERDDLGHCGLGLRTVWYKIEMRRRSHSAKSVKNMRSHARTTASPALLAVRWHVVFAFGITADTGSNIVRDVC
jgi:hypothetical protein